MMPFKKSREVVPQQETPIWMCEQKEICKGWIREDFAFEEVPYCPLCSSTMVHGTKMLPVIVNESKEPKTNSPVWRRSKGIV